MKKIYTLLLAVMAIGSAAFAQTDGYNRLKNAGTGHVANFESSYSFAPNATMEEAVSLPGTVAWMAFEDDVVTSLKAQNVDLVNVVIPTMKEIIPTIIDENTFAALKDSVIDMANTFMGKAMATVLVGAVRRYSYDNFLTYVDEMDTKLYFNKVEGGYQLYMNAPPFPLDAGDLTSYVTGKINGYLSLYYGTMEELAKQYLVGRESMLPMVNSFVEHFKFGEIFYLIEQQDPTYGPQFGFANSLDIDSKGDVAVWTFDGLDNASNFFGPKGAFQDGNGKWYAPFAADFSITLPKGITAWYVTNEVDPGKSQIQRMKVQEGTVIPPMTPIILELNGPEAADNKVVVGEDWELDVLAEDNALSLATDTLDFLLGKTLPAPDSHYYVFGLKEGKLALVESEQTFFEPNEPFFYLDDARKEKNTSGCLVLEDNVDAIGTILAGKPASGVYYDLQGRPVEHPTKGIYIIDGKKVVLK